MNIYTIDAETAVEYDSYSGFVIAANNKDEVVILARASACDEGGDAWKKENVMKIGAYIGKRKIPFVVLSSFNAG